MKPLNASVTHFNRFDGPRHGVIVVIDVLRATTVIVFALANGAREIIPVGAPKPRGALQEQLTARCSEVSSTIEKFPVSILETLHTKTTLGYSAKP